MRKIKWQGRQVELLKKYKWKGQILRIMTEFHDRRYGQVLYVYLGHVKNYVIGNCIVTDKATIDYLDDKYGMPTNIYD